jgi:hypothetical protein
MPNTKKIPIHFETDEEHNAKIQKLIDEKGWSLKETMHYFIDGKVEETCACEGCDWYDGFDYKRGIPRCLNPNPPIDKKFLSRTSGEICRKMLEEMLQLQKALGQKMSWKKIQKSKNIDVAIAIAKKYNVIEAEIDSARQNADFFKIEAEKLNAIERKYAELQKSLPKIEGYAIYLAKDKIKEFLSSLHEIFGY